MAALSTSTVLSLCLCWLGFTAVFAGKLINTGDDYEYVSLGGDFSHRTFVSFSVRACSDAFITLQPAPADHGIQEYGFEILIGGWGNTRSVIRSSFHFQQAEELASATGTYLDCNQARSFWVSWAGGKIQVGTGHQFSASSRFLEADMVKAVAVSTGWGSNGTWAFDLQNSVTLFTPDAHIYQMVGLDFTVTNHVIFMVQACNDAHVRLQAVSGKDDPAGYEIIIGGWGNTLSAIKGGRDISNIKEAAGSRVSCNCAKPFWVSWAGNKIRVGEGYIVSDASKFLETPFIRNVGVATGFSATEGVWNID